MSRADLPVCSAAGAAWRHAGIIRRALDQTDSTPAAWACPLLLLTLVQRSSSKAEFWVHLYRCQCVQRCLGRHQYPLMGMQPSCHQGYWLLFCSTPPMKMFLLGFQSDHPSRLKAKKSQERYLKNDVLENPKGSDGRNHKYIPLFCVSFTVQCHAWWHKRVAPLM